MTFVTPGRPKHFPIRRELLPGTLLPGSLMAQHDFNRQ